MKCRLCLTPLEKTPFKKEELSVEDFYITKKSNKKTSLTVCKNCGLVQSDSFIPSEKLLECYQNVKDIEVEKEFSGRKLTFQRDILKCVSIIDKDPQDILEIGAFTGIAAEAIKEILPMANYIGIEPSSWACNMARNRGQNVIQGQIGDRLEKTFDLIFAWDVIEHLEDPHVFFTWCNELTTDASYLFINTPNWESILRKIFGKRWWFIEPMHRTYFTPHTLKLIAQKHQWQMLKIWRHTKTVSLPYLVHRALMEHFNLNINIIKGLTQIKVSLYIGQMSVLLKRL